MELTKLSMNCLKNIHFILATKSPRRIEFLKNLNLNFKVYPSGFKEELKDFITPEQYVINNSLQKAEDVSKNFENSIIAGFDTIVLFQNKILGKPKNSEDAFNMLSMLSNSTHKVITAYTLLHKKKDAKITKYVTTDVFFKNLKNDEIKWYISTNEPYDKAGAYAIQGIGAFMVKKINGSYTNVVGLPLAEFLEDLKNFYHNL